MNTATTTVKKTVVPKTIPKKIMGYLKFAHFIITHPETDILHTLFLDKPIEQIVALVNDVVVNGDQDKIILELHKQFKNSSKPSKPSKPSKSKKTNADIIVDDLVTLAREPEPKKARANPDTLKKTRTKKTNPVTTTPIEETGVTTHLHEPITTSVDPVTTSVVEDPVVEDPVVEDPVEETVVVNPVVEETVNPVVVNPVEETVEEPVVTPKNKKNKKPITDEVVPEPTKKNKKKVVENK
jgi:hypothetical protein